MYDMFTGENAMGKKEIEGDGNSLPILWSEGP